MSNDNDQALSAGAVPEDSRVVTVEWLKRIHRDLDACQKVIWGNLRGCDPAYYEDAQARLKEIDAMLTAAPTAPVEGGGVLVARWNGYGAIENLNTYLLDNYWEQPVDLYTHPHNGEHQAPEQRCTHPDCGRFFDENAKRWQCKARRDDACALDHPTHNGEQGGECEPDFFWSADNPEDGSHEDEHSLADWCAQDLPFGETMVVDVDCAKRLPSRQMKIWVDDDDDLQWEWVEPTPPTEREDGHE